MSTPTQPLIDPTPTPTLLLGRRAVRAGAPPRIAPTDGELLALVALVGGEASQRDAALERLIERHAPMVWAVCRQVLRNPADAEDAFQATFLILARHARSIRSSESAAGWLYRVAHRTALAARREASRRREEPLAHEPTAPPEEPFPDLVGRQSVAILMEELQALPERYRTPLVLRYLEGQTRREIADQTETTLPTVQGRLARGKKLLRRRLVRRGVSLAGAMAVVAGGASQASAAPKPLVVATAANFQTLVHGGGALTASALTLSLYREGARAMLIASMAKPAGVAAGVLFAAMLATAPQLAADDAPAQGVSGALVLDAAVAAEADSLSDGPKAVLQAAAPVATGAGQQPSDAAHRLKTGQALHIRVDGTLPDWPIDGVFRIEPEGTVALGPVYGRAKVAGRSIDEAEQIVRKRLGLTVKDPIVQIARQGDWPQALEAPPGRQEKKLPHAKLAQAAPPADVFVPAVNAAALPINGVTIEERLEPGEMAINGKKLTDAEQAEVLRKMWAQRAQTEGGTIAPGVPSFKELHLQHTYWDQRAQALRLKSQAVLRVLNAQRKRLSPDEARVQESEAILLSADMFKAKAEALRLERELKSRALAMTDASPEKTRGLSPERLKTAPQAPGVEQWHQRFSKLPVFENRNDNRIGSDGKPATAEKIEQDTRQRWLKMAQASGETDLASPSWEEQTAQFQAARERFNQLEKLLSFKLQLRDQQKKELSPEQWIAIELEAAQLLAEKHAAKAEALRLERELKSRALAEAGGQRPGPKATPAVSALPAPDDGVVVQRWPDGTDKSVSEYVDGELVERVEYEEDGTPTLEYENYSPEMRARSEAAKQAETSPLEAIEDYLKRVEQRADQAELLAAQAEGAWNSAENLDLKTLQMAARAEDTSNSDSWFSRRVGPFAHAIRGMVKQDHDWINGTGHHLETQAADLLRESLKDEVGQSAEAIQRLQEKVAGFTKRYRAAKERAAAALAEAKMPKAYRKLAEDLKNRPAADLDVATIEGGSLTIRKKSAQQKTALKQTEPMKEIEVLVKQAELVTKELEAIAEQTQAAARLEQQASRGYGGRGRLGGEYGMGGRGGMGGGFGGAPTRGPITKTFVARGQKQIRSSDEAIRAAEKAIEKWVTERVDASDADIQEIAKQIERQVGEFSQRLIDLRKHRRSLDFRIYNPTTQGFDGGLTTKPAAPQDSSPPAVVSTPISPPKPYVSNTPAAISDPRPSPWPYGAAPPPPSDAVSPGGAYAAENKAYGHSVERLQERLNERLDPTPGLSVDGDYGPATKGAVRRFQQENGIPASGFANRVTRQALGLEEETTVEPVGAGELYPGRNRVYGHSVERLQERLNERLDPSPELSVDGDYGPLTTGAVQRFQKENGLPPTGFADDRTRAKLGLKDDQKRDASGSDDAANPYGAGVIKNTGSAYCRHEPSVLNPIGWATVAELAPGEHAPILLPGDARPRPQVKLLTVENGGARFQIVYPGLDRREAVWDASSPTKIVGVAVETRLLGPGRRAGSHLLLIRQVEVDPQGEFKLIEEVPSVEAAWGQLGVKSWAETGDAGSVQVNKVVTRRVLGRIEHHDGSADGKKSLGGSGHLMRFELPEGVTRVKAIRVHGSRYGKREAPREDFEIAFLSEDREEILAVEHAAYGLFRRGEEKWVTIRFKQPVELPEKFWVGLDFAPGRTKGVYVSYDTSTGGERSMTGTAQQDPSEHRPTDFGGDWMIALLPERPAKAAARDPSIPESMSDEQVARTASMNNLKDLVIALHNYDNQHGRLPPGAIHDKQGSALLSWRVALLPMLGEKELYNEFRLNEPWDSPHNLELLQHMPKVFQNELSDRGLKQGFTRYLGARGDNSIFGWGINGRRFEEVRDGTSRTVAIVAVDDAHAVEWTRPADYFTEKHQENPLGGIVGRGAKDFLAAYADGHVQGVATDQPASELHALFTIEDVKADELPMDGVYGEAAFYGGFGGEYGVPE